MLKLLRLLYKVENRDWYIAEYRCSCGRLKESIYRKNIKNNVYCGMCTKTKEIFPNNDMDLGYICGLIASDGCLASKNDKNPCRISINLHEDDLETLKWMVKTTIDPEFKQPKITKKIKNNGSNRQYRLELYVHKLYQYCLDMGITPRKSLNLNVNLEDKSNEFRRYFLRGVIDGDGDIGVRGKPNSKKISISCSSIVFLETLNKFFPGTIYTPKTFNVNPGTIENRVIRSTIAVSRLIYTGENLLNLCKVIPIDGFCMIRKTEKILDIIEWYKSNKNYSFNGVNYYTFEDMCKDNKHNSIMNQTVRARLNSGWDLKDALKIPKSTKSKRKLNKYLYKDNLYTIRELSNMCGKPINKIRKRIVEFNWSVEDAITR